MNIKRIIYYFGGLIFLSLGISLTLLSNLGAGGWDALAENISKASSLSVGKCVFVISIVLLLSASLFSKKYPDIRVLAVSYGTGMLIDIWYYTVLGGKIFSGVAPRFAALLFGLLFVGLGCAMMFVTNFPKNHTETFVFSVSDRIKRKYKWVKIGADSSALVISLALGFYLDDFSNIGIGTFLSSFFMGVIIDKILVQVEKVY